MTSMLKSFVKSFIRGGARLVRKSPALLAFAKWVLDRSGPLGGAVRTLVGKSFRGRPTISVQRLTNAELRAFVDLKHSMDVYGTRNK